MKKRDIKHIIKLNASSTKKDIMDNQEPGLNSQRSASGSRMYETFGSPTPS